ncbi:MAG: SEC-C domain-containing protein [Betaproteobacteria bacterium]|nr:SEC-C domain-containing protein [Betaproteobacteria bacterium]
MAGAPVSRNAPCPCGSGRRYRECHGAIDASPSPTASRTTAAATYRPRGSDWDGIDPAERARLAELMDTALARQASNDQSGAARLYREVLAVAPQTHDALHMLAVAQWGLGDLDEASRLMERAFSQRDPYPAIVTNRETLQRARAPPGESTPNGGRKRRCRTCWRGSPPAQTRIRGTRRRRASRST